MFFSVGVAVVRSRLRDRRDPGWRPGSTEDPPYMRPAARHTTRSSQTPPTGVARVTVAHLIIRMEISNLLILGDQSYNRTNLKIIKEIRDRAAAQRMGFYVAKFIMKS
ncbi:hypothetical protein AVEN_94547-1 [Araneus ventricosus]|uniref:Uncharacterized protein n=1 Tax=Araneus ventricosus TaxID=182803 RepID=A0A4Y2SI15_ARAVE|nr:hypothetical protein AVEN_94547-1 [Araneus ventricosus]